MLALISSTFAIRAEPIDELIGISWTFQIQNCWTAHQSHQRRAHRRHQAGPGSCVQRVLKAIHLRLQPGLSHDHTSAVYAASPVCRVRQMVRMEAGGQFRYRHGPIDGLFSGLRTSHVCASICISIQRSGIRAANAHIRR